MAEIRVQSTDKTLLLLEADKNHAAKTNQSANYGQGIPTTVLMVDDLNQAYKRLTELNARFFVTSREPNNGCLLPLINKCRNFICLTKFRYRRKE